MRIRTALIIASFFTPLAASAAFAGTGTMDDLVVVDHQPNQIGGGVSDTAFLDLFGEPYSNRIADDFELASAAEIGDVRWWGFYDQDNPPVTEAFRIRFYAARPGDGLPDENNILYDQAFNDPTRTATGERVAVTVLPDEYLFEAPLDHPLPLMAGTRYWLEVIQVGDLSTAFRWEFSQAEGNGQAFVNAVTVDWQATTLTSDTAYQLIAVPEPATLIPLIGFFAAQVLRPSRSRRNGVE